jgi:adenylate cyclase
MRRRFGLVFSLGLSLVFIFLYRPILFGIKKNNFFGGLENTWQDFLFQINRPLLKRGDPRIIIAAVDDLTLERYGYPLPRAVFAQLSNRLRKLGVKTLVFDVLFIDHRKGDAQLAQSLQKFKSVVLPYAFDPNPKNALTLPISPLLHVVKNFGYVTIGDDIDADGHIRRFRLFHSSIKNPETNLSAEALEVPAYTLFTGEPLNSIIPRNASEQYFFVNFNPPTYSYYKTANQAAARLNARDIHQSPHRIISIAKILGPNLPPEIKSVLKGSLVLVGSTALAAFDHFPSPFKDTSPGVEYHANVIDNLLHHNWMRPWSPYYQILVILLFIWLPFFLRRLSPLVASFSTLGVFLAWAGFCEWQFLSGIRIEFILPSTALLFSFVGETIYQSLTEGREKKFIKNLFAQFVSPEVVEDLARNPEKIKLGGEKKDMTILFLDIAHFTSISEKMSPEDLIAFLNRYLSRLSQVIQDHQGVVDKYIGDSIMAFWNAPVEVKSHRVKACLTALSIQEAVLELNKNLPAGIAHTPEVRIGINSGFVTVGLTGSEHKLQYTVIGDEVNLASRLEGANKFFRSKTMISEAVYSEAKAEIEAREVGIIRVLGKEIPIKTYQILARKGALPRAWKTALPIYNQALQDVRNKEYVNAIALFDTFLKIIPNDGIASFYLSACKKAQESTPWDGIIHLSAK